MIQNECFLIFKTEEPRGGGGAVPTCFVSCRNHPASSMTVLSLHGNWEGPVFIFRQFFLVTEAFQVGQ